jgi:hypothetical protein
VNDRIPPAERPTEAVRPDFSRTDFGEGPPPVGEAPEPNYASKDVLAPDDSAIARGARRATEPNYASKDAPMTRDAHD